MALDTIKMTMDSNFVGEMESPTGVIRMGDQAGGMQPYHLLFGALASCFYSTFLVISKKKRLTFDKADVVVSGYKENTGKEKNLLEHVTIEMTITNPSNEKGLEKSAELGAQFCSIHETISRVAKVETIVKFQ
ncbi:MAG: OsmC family protein [Bacilli bacterium]|nr:OsmC family protein [Bacilli bacterium]MBN2877737.1 OsmC family protein [Bacilli bacterium]